jgi:hypothetical protein
MLREDLHPFGPPSTRMDFTNVSGRINIRVKITFLVNMSLQYCFKVKIVFVYF